MREIGGVELPEDAEGFQLDSEGRAYGVIWRGRHFVIFAASKWYSAEKWSGWMAWVGLLACAPFTGLEGAVRSVVGLMSDLEFQQATEHRRLEIEADRRATSPRAKKAWAAELDAGEEGGQAVALEADAFVRNGFVSAHGQRSQRVFSRARNQLRNLREVSPAEVVPL